MTVKEYNSVWCPLIKDSTVFLGALEQNIQKANTPEEALRNLQILGWGPELKRFLNDAVSVYQETLLNQIEMPEKSAPAVEVEPTAEVFSAIKKIIQRESGSILSIPNCYCDHAPTALDILSKLEKEFDELGKKFTQQCGGNRGAR